MPELSSPTMPAWFLDNWLQHGVIPHTFGVWRLHPGWRHRRVHRRYYELYVILDGSAIITADHSSLALDRGGACLLPPGHPFIDGDGALATGTRLLVADFSLASAASFDPLQTLGLPQAVDLTDNKVVDRALKGLGQRHGPWPMASPRVRLHVRGVLDLVLGQFLDRGFRCGAFRPAATEPMPKWLWHVLAHVEAHVSQPHLQVGDLATHAGLSPSHLSHQFRRYLGLSPKRWLLNRRFALARSLLANDPLLPVGEVAERCGFGDPYQFSRAFSRRMGSSPSAWRHQIHEPEDHQVTADPR